MKIILIGFMGSGKSTVAKSLSALLKFQVLEMDDVVYQKTDSKTMNEVFAKGGEQLLRQTEIAIAKEYGRKENLIISSGGGVVLNPVIFEYFNLTKKKVFFLHATFQTIAKRLEGDRSRPLFRKAKELYDARLPLYFNYADEVISVDFLSPEKIAFQIKECIRGV